MSVEKLFHSCGLHLGGAVPWNERVSLEGPGVYAVASTADINDSVGSLPRYRYNPAALERLFEVCPDIRVDGSKATKEDLAARLDRFWITDAPILYIGRAGSSIQQRTSQFYKTQLGHRSPHSGGWWLKTLAGLDELYVHYAATGNPRAMEARLIDAFAESIPIQIRAELHDPERIAPFANVEVRPGLRKRHGMTGYKIPAMLPMKTSVKVKEPLASFASEITTVDSCIESQIITAKDRHRSSLRIPARSKHALPAENGWLTVEYRGEKQTARWRVNGGRSGTIGVGRDIMAAIGETGHSVWLDVHGLHLRVIEEPT